MNKHIYLLVSSSKTLLDQKIEQLIKENDFSKEAITTYDMEETPLTKVLEDVDTISFLTPKKVIIANHCSFLESKEKEDEDAIDHLFKYINNAISEVMLIFTTTKLDERKKVVKDLKKKINILQLTPETDQLIKDNLKGYQVESGVRRLLKEYTKENYEKIFQECEKLKLYKINDKKITIEDVNTLVEKPLDDKDETSFAFVRSLATKNKKEAFRYYQQLEKMNLEPFAMMGLLESQYRLLYQIMLLARQNNSSSEIAKRLEVHPFRVTKTLELTRYYSLKEVSDFLKNLAQMDYKMKSGQLDSSMILETLIINS